MPALPAIGGDNNIWGAELNAWLLVGHNPDGTNNLGNHTRSRVFPLLYPSGTFPLIVPLWRVPYSITITAIYVYRLGGTGATLNARKLSAGVATTLLVSDFSATTTNPWVAAGSLAAGSTLAAGDSLEALVQSITGTPNYLAIQIDYLEPVA